jgi:hypothetical protein
VVFESSSFRLRANFRLYDLGMYLVVQSEILRRVFDGLGRFVGESLRRGKWLGDRSLFGRLLLTNTNKEGYQIEQIE